MGCFAARANGNGNVHRCLSFDFFVIFIFNGCLHIYMLYDIHCDISLAGLILYQYLFVLFLFQSEGRGILFSIYIRI